VGRLVEIKDTFYRFVPVVPDDLVRAGVTPRTHVLFETDPLVGGNLLCVMSRTNEDGLKILDTAVEGTRLLLRGQVLQRFRTRALFRVDEIYRGWEERPLDLQREVVISLSSVPRPDPQRGEVNTYTIPELGKVFKIACPGVAQPIYIKVELREPKEGK
jgi:hypothetical protein